MHNTTNIIEALAIGMLFGAIAGSVGALVLSSTGAARRRARDRERLVRMQRYLADAQATGRELRVAGYSRGVVTFDTAGLERLARAAAAADTVDPPYSAAGGSFGVKPAPPLTLVDTDN